MYLAYIEAMFGQMAFLFVVLYLLFTSSWWNKKRKSSAEPLNHTDLTELRGLLAQGGKVAAVRRYRELTGAGLLEAATAVEQLTEST